MDFDGGFWGGWISDGWILAVGFHPGGFQVSAPSAIFLFIIHIVFTWKRHRIFSKDMLQHRKMGRELFEKIVVTKVVLLTERVVDPLPLMT